MDQEAIANFLLKLSVLAWLSQRTGGITSVEMIDLFEAEIGIGAPMMVVPVPVMSKKREAAVDKALQVLSKLAKSGLIRYDGSAPIRWYITDSGKLAFDAFKETP